jgi:Uma2 family endonuclease
MTDATLIREQATEQPPRRMTWEEWLAWAPDDYRSEWVEGEVVEHGLFTYAEHKILKWLTILVDIFVEYNELGTVRALRSTLKLSKVPSARQPDLIFLAKENEDRQHEYYIEGPADAVWEVVSPESVARDRGDKFIEYETEGIGEYWLIDPERELIQLYRLRRSGRYQLVLPEEGKLHSAAIRGFYLRPEWLWGEPMARAWEVLPELGISEM